MESSTISYIDTRILVFFFLILITFGCLDELYKYYYTRLYDPNRCWSFGRTSENICVLKINYSCLEEQDRLQGRGAL